jgi:hypothetical protein
LDDHGERYESAETKDNGQKETKEETTNPVKMNSSHTVTIVIAQQVVAIGGLLRIHSC